MSINAVSGVAQTSQTTSQPRAASPSPAASPFGKQLDDVQATQTLASHGHNRATHAKSASGAPTAADRGAHSSGTVTALLAQMM